MSNLEGIIVELPADFDRLNVNPKPRRDESKICGNCDAMYYPRLGEGFKPLRLSDNPYDYAFCDVGCFLSWTKYSQDPKIYKEIKKRTVTHCRTSEPDCTPIAYPPREHLLQHGGHMTLDEYKNRITVPIFYEGGGKRICTSDAKDREMTLPDVPEDVMMETENWLSETTQHSNGDVDDPMEF